MGVLQRFWNKLLELFTEDVGPQVLYFSTTEDWVKKNVKSLLKSIETQVKVSDDVLMLLEEIKQLYTKREQGIHSVNTNQLRLRTLSQQKDEKEVDLLRAKDSDEYRSLVPQLEQEKEMHASCEELDDSLFLSLVRLKATLSELQDFNSNYELLDVIKAVNTIQENFSYFFQDHYYDALLDQLRGVKDKISMGSLLEKEDVEFPFNILFDQFTSGDFAEKREERVRLINSLSTLARTRLQNNIFTKIEDLKYRLDHFVEQEKQLREQVELQKNTLLEVTQELSKKKQIFEQYILRHLKREVTLDVGNLEIIDEKQTKISSFENKN